MKILYSLIIILGLFSSCNNSKDLFNYVNPFVGTGGHGHTFPGATVPFGMVQLSPDSRLEGWDGCGGYHYSDSIIFLNVLCLQLQSKKHSSRWRLPCKLCLQGFQ